MTDVIELARSNNGVVTSGQVTVAGIPRRRLTEAVEAGELVRVGRGLYILSDAWEDEFLTLQHRFSRGVFSHGSALFLNAMTDTTPSLFAMTFPRSYNASSARAEGVEVHTASDKVLGLGLARLTTPAGNEVRAYDAERTICDMLRGQAVPDMQLLAPAMKAYARSGSRDVPKLLAYARDLGVERKVRERMVMLL